MKFLVFGGTTEGRMIAEWLGGFEGCQTVVYCATEYGGSLVEGNDRLEARTARLSAGEMAEVMADGFQCVIDATHPYAAMVTENVRAAAEAAGLDLVRLVREEEPQGPWIGAKSPQEAAKLLAEGSGAILLTTGSKDLKTFVETIPDYQERLYVRVLPVMESLEAALSLGIPVSHIVAMQGPFGQELNEALIHQLGIQVLVTKASGSTGGFWEKINAAQACGIDALVIHRPLDEVGLTFDQVKDELARRYGL